jgi:hypothetical protein
MSAVRELTIALIKAGIDPVEATILIARAGIEMAPPADTRTAGARRQSAWRERNKPSQTVSQRRDDETSQSVSNRNEASQSNASQNPPISTSKISKESKRQNRGTRIAGDWTLSEADRAFAKAEGFSDWEIQREVQKFRDYWTACAGSKGVKLDWPATWRQWIRSGAERAGKTPARSANAPAANAPGFYATADSEQLAAWDAHTQRTTGKLLPRDRNFGWRVPAEWPPGHGKLQLEAAE